MAAELREKDLWNAVWEGPTTPGSGPGVLIADEMPMTQTVLELELEARGFNVWLAVDGDDAIDLYRHHRDEIDLVILAVDLPGLNGPRTLAALQAFDPDVAACFLTSSSKAPTEDELGEGSAVCVFLRPIQPVEVADLLQKVMGGRTARAVLGDRDFRASLPANEVTGKRCCKGRATEGRPLG